ncbi:hypothetical protein RCL_jg21956.t1 [Rhizophagus clarus]|uniref:Uncharacterized protein n=1 Tax=Rhizophagus clarus TaxID=94130 RepID=A0A8H3MGF5_9GLOM|nr:hypothetical protein RCL_jg21956.t1 [Rhizophagus clarus]
MKKRWLFRFLEVDTSISLRYLDAHDFGSVTFLMVNYERDFRRDPTISFEGFWVRWFLLEWQTFPSDFHWIGRVYLCRVPDFLTQI